MSTEILKFTTQYSLCSGYIIFVAGVIGNALNILVFTQLKLFRANRCAFYLTAESIFSFLFQFLPLSLTILTSIYGDDATARSAVWCKFRYVFSQTLILIIYSMICCTAVDQFFSTNYRFNLRQMCTLKIARYLTFTFLCFAIIHSIVFGFFYDIQPSLECVIWNSILIQYATFFYYPVMIGLLPLVLASLFSILAFRNVRRIVRRQLPIVRRRLDRQITAMVLMRVIVFVCFVLPYTVYRVYAVNFPISPTDPIKYAIGRLIQATVYSFFSFNYAVSFYVFVISSSRFRRQVKLVLIKKYWQRWKRRFCCIQNQIGPENAELDRTNRELEEDI